MSVIETCEILIAGTGFAGLCAAIKLEQSGQTSFLLLEKAEDYGGTWRDNIYPGCACDIPSHLYSLSFEPKTDWSRMYPTQPEIFAYLRAVAAKHDLRGRTRFGAKLEEATWDEARGVWRVTCADGRVFEGRMLFSAMGPLHIPSIPRIEGAESFAGAAFHSAHWDFSQELAGKRVAVIGTGASAIQFIPQIAPKVAKLTVFQRTPPWIMPKPDYPFTERQKRRFGLPLMRALFRKMLFWMHEVRALGFLGNARVTAAAEAMGRTHLAKQVPDPALRARLTPDYRVGCKRVLLSNDYLPALSRDNVELVTNGIARMTHDAIIDTQGRAHPADIVIYGTGFRTTDSFAAVRIVGRNGLELNTAFAGGMHAHWGIAVPDFPNLFLLLGPNTGLGHNSVVLMIEAQVRYIMSLLRQMRARGWRAIEVRREAEAAWNDKIQGKIAGTVWLTGGCKSWYLDENGRNTTIWPGFVAEYQFKTRRAKIAEWQETVVREQLPV
jgi:cation diffusion facilitator CzcD-associated flavoprotein CzcO